MTSKSCNLSKAFCSPQLPGILSCPTAAGHLATQTSHTQTIVGLGWADAAGGHQASTIYFCLVLPPWPPPCIRIVLKPRPERVATSTQWLHLLPHCPRNVTRVRAGNAAFLIWMIVSQKKSPPLLSTCGLERYFRFFEIFKGIDNKNTLQCCMKRRVSKKINIVLKGKFYICVFQMFMVLVHLKVGQNTF